MRERSKCELDIIDIHILQELARDGRIPVRHLAAKTGISQHAAVSRLHRLIGEGVTKVVAIAVSRSARSTIEAFIGLNVKPGHNVHTLADRLVSSPNIPLVALVSGRYNIVTRALFNNLEALSTFLRQEVGNIPGVASTETLIHLETVKNVLTYPISEAGSNSHRPIPHGEKKQAHQIDSLDMLIIEELQKDGRMTVVQLAKKLGISRANAAKRLQRLLSEDVIVIIAVTDPGSFGYKVTARVGVNVLPGMVDDVAQKLASFSAVHFVAVTIGHYDILLGVHFTELYELSHFIGDILSEIPGIVKTENMIYLEILKNPFQFVTRDHNQTRGDLGNKDQVATRASSSSIPDSPSPK